MNKFFLFTGLFLFTLMSFGSSKVSIRFTNEKELFLNDIKLSPKTKFKEVVAELGEPKLIKEYPTGKKVYHYESEGIAVHTVEDKLLFIGVNYNWDGDKKFPESTYKGDLSIGDVVFNKESKDEIVSEITVVKIDCLMPGLCMTNPKEEKTFIVLGFENNMVTQVGFELH